MSTINDTDLFVIERSGTQYQVRSDEMSTLNDTDLFVVERAGVQYKVEAADLDLGPTGSMESPVDVLTPLNGAGLNDGQLIEPLSSAITTVGAAGSTTFSTDAISSVAASNNVATLTFPTSNNFEQFAVGDVVQSDWNQSQTWTSAPYFTGNPAGYSGRSLSNAFNGVVQLGTGAWSTGANPALGETWTLNFTEFSSINKLEIVCWADVDSNTAQSLKVNGSSVTVASLNNAQKFEVAVNSLQSISWSYPANNQGVAMQGIYVNEKLLVDQSVTNPNAISITAINAAGPTITTDGGTWTTGDTISKLFSYDALLTFSDNTNLSSIIGPVEMTDASGAVKVPTTSTITNVDTTTSAPDVVLTFADNTDLSFFSAGDELDQTTTGTGVANFSPGGYPSTVNTANVFDGDASTFATVGGVGSGTYAGPYWTLNPVTVALDEVILTRCSRAVNLPKGKNCKYTSVNGDTYQGDINTRTPAGQSGSWVSFAGSQMTGSRTIDKYQARLAFNNTSEIAEVGSVVICDSATLAIKQVLTNDIQVPIEVVSTDTAAKTMTVNGSGYIAGDTVTAPQLAATSTGIAYQTGSQLALNGTTGTYLAGLHVEGAQITASAPSASEIVFTSSNGGTTAYSGTDSSLSNRTWTLQSGSSASGPWTVVGTFVDGSANASQDGATAWAAAPTLSADTYYQVKVRYDSTNAEYVESNFNTFKTSA